MTLQPRWSYPRSYPRVETPPVPPPRQPTTYLPTHSTKASRILHFKPPSTATPDIKTETSTQWWPPGVQLGSRMPRTGLPVHVVFPKILKWGRNWPNIPVRTSATRFTYPPDVLNYPITLDWHVPRDQRTDKWTQRPDWPLESPLFSSEVYDYLEDVTLPPPLESGETEYPPTSPLPWWTYPPWWLKKIEEEKLNGTTPRPYGIKAHRTSDNPNTFATTGVSSTTPSSTSSTRQAVTVPAEKPLTNTEQKTTVRTRSATVKATSRDVDSSEAKGRLTNEKVHLTTLKIKLTSKKVDLSSAKTASPTLTSTIETKKGVLGKQVITTLKPNQDSLYRKTHHKGPWWHLTVIEPLSRKPPPNESEEKTRVKRSAKLVRQNAFRRKWKKLRQRKNLSEFLELGKPQLLFPVENGDLSLKFSFLNSTWPKPKEEKLILSKYDVEKLLVKALDEFKQQFMHTNSNNKVGRKIKCNLSYSDKKQVELQKHLFDLHNLFSTVLNSFVYKRNRSLLFDLFTNEIGVEMLKKLLNGTNVVRQELEKILCIRSQNQIHKKTKCVKLLSKCRLILFYQLFCKYGVIHYDTREKIINVFKSLFKIDEIDFLRHNPVTNTYLDISKHVFLQKIKLDSETKEKLAEENHFTRRKREDKTITITESPFNLSSQSIEEVVDEIIEELPMKEINREVETEILTEMQVNQLKRLGKTHINREVLREMAKIESTDEANFRKATEDSVKAVMMTMVDEVLKLLRKNAWMKDLMIKLFNEGYSVETVVEAISNEISIEELMESLTKNGLNITQSQRKLVLEEFKDYKWILRKMLMQEVQIWEHEAVKNETLIRRKRDASILIEKTNMKIKQFRNPVMRDVNDWTKNMKIIEPLLRHKRDIDNSQLSKSVEHIRNKPETYDENDVDIDRELSELKKSSMSKREKMKVLKNRLNSLLGQTENPDDIVFPENFEEELMRTEVFYDEVTRIPKQFKQRAKWNVRTKKPTTKVITYPMKIRLNRGRPFVPLTTTEKPTRVLVVTKVPSRKSRTRKSKPVLTNSLIMASFQPTPTLKKQFWLDFTSKSVTLSDTKHTKIMRKFNKITIKPAKTSAMVKSFHTMKSLRKTLQPVISLQEFLKRRNEFRRVRQEGRFNRPSSEESDDSKSTDIENFSDLSKEEEFSLEANLSGGENPSDFTLPPLLDTSEQSGSRIEKPSMGNEIPIEGLKTSMPKTSHRGRRKKNARTKPPTRTNKTRRTRPSSKKSLSINKSSLNVSEEISGGVENKTFSREEKECIRSKRDLSTTYGHRPFTDSPKVKANLGGVTVPVLVVNEKLKGLKQNISRLTLEQKIHLHNWAYGVQQPSESSGEANTTIDSFETYQQEHKKWFGIKRRGVPVNNFDIDWDQMRRKMEIHQISYWQRQRSNSKPTSGGKLQRRHERVATPLTQATTPLFTDSSEKPSILLDDFYKSAPKTYKSKTFFKHRLFDESLDSRTSEVKDPPLGKVKTYKSKSFCKHCLSDESLDSRTTEVNNPPLDKMEKGETTVSGRLYQGKKFYQVEDLRDKHFNENDIQQFMNKTYDPEFRISTHRKSQWHNRTFDPNFIFTQPVPFSRKLKSGGKFSRREVIHSKVNESKATSLLTNDFYTPSETERYFKILKNQHLTIKPRHKSFLDKENNTVIISHDNDTYVLTRSKRVPWENNTDIEEYKTYIRSRKRFYNKTIDIAFSYYIFHKFKCGNKTRDLGYGRMSNVVNRWYNRTFIPKFRPDMFYIRNRYKYGKEFNYFRDEINELHAIMSEGEFDPYRWMLVAGELRFDDEFQVKTTSLPEIYEETKPSKKNKTVIEYFSPYHPWALPSRPPNTNLKLTTTGRLKEKRTVTPTEPPTAKISFFKAVKEKGYGFFKSLFGKQDSNESEE